jgi:thiosulfate/3-mercaptopyruvate sulfurtransferase
MHTTLLSPSELVPHLDDPTWLALDCRFTLADPQKSEGDYLQAHIPGAVYAHLERDLSGPIIPGKTGRHPLPTPEQAAKSFARLGVGDETQVVVYDDAGGALAAVRAWWMLRWLGHQAVAVLDGGWKTWLAEGRPPQAGRITRPPAAFTAQVRQGLFKTSAEVDALRLDPAYRLVDVRAAERYHGKNETIDPLAGHIPGAISAPYTENLAPDGRFLPPETLRQRYLNLLSGVPAEQTVFYCGSGVTSIHAILAMLHAGLGEARLYAGSWSEWITSPDHPIAKD